MSSAPPWLTLPTRLDGPKVLLRTYLPSDGAALWAAAEEARDCPYLQWNRDVHTPADATALATRLATSSAERRSLRFAVCCRASGRLIGGAGLVGVDWQLPAYNLAWWLRREAQGWGYATEAVRLVVDACFTNLDAMRVGAIIEASNLRSIGVAERVGLRREATIRNALLDKQGRPAAIVSYAVIREDREAGRPTMPSLAWLGQGAERPNSYLQ